MRSPMYSKFCHNQKYYVCSDRKMSFPDQPKCPSSRHYNGVDLEGLVWDEFLKAVQSPAMLLRRINQRQANKDADRTVIEARIKDIDNGIPKEEDKKNRLVVAYSENVMTLEELKNRKDEIQKTIDAKNSEKQKLATKLSATSEELPDVIDLDDFSARIASLLEDYRFYEKTSDPALFYR